jgi:uncharacterized membrane protein
MSKGRLEAFTDGVIAILITIMVLDLKVPAGTDLASLAPLGPVFLSYVLSFALLGTYWNNHHHLLQATKVIDGRVLLANLFLLFWLSLFPFAAAWMGESGVAPIPTALYGVVSVMAGTAYFFLELALIATKGQAPALKAALGTERKSQISAVTFICAVPIAVLAPPVAFALYVAVVVMWFIPDRRIERALSA